ncbi:MAG: hypothetical protein V4692_07385 [Bdellovibrionota bacterium]
MNPFGFQSSHQSGQMTIEAILIMTILMAITVAVSSGIRNQQVLASIVEGPWAATQGMIEDGVWQPVSVSKVAHPSKSSRRRSFIGESVDEGK